MASLQEYPNGIFHVHFRIRGQRFKRSLKTRNHVEARGRVARLRDTIRLVEAGRLELPHDQDVGVFLLTDGKQIDHRSFSDVRSLKQLFAAYDVALPPGAKEESTLEGEQLHRRHMLRILTGRRLITTIKQGVLQDYINRRLREKHHGQFIQPATIKKEITTLRLIWNWAIEEEHVACPLPTRKLVYPKIDEKSPFMTWAQIEIATVRRSLSDLEEKKLWESLFLQRDEIDAYLDDVRESARYPVSYPLLVSVAHTGARRSELLRALMEDFDLSRRVVTIREKKKSRQKATTYRHVPMSERLHQAMTNWYANHPGGRYAFCERPEEPLNGGTARRCFKLATRVSRWGKIRGFHVFRHSFASNLAAAGVDQRIIDEWMGHQTDEMRRRYRHLFPDQQREALELVFGGAQSSIGNGVALR